MTSRVQTFQLRRGECAHTTPVSYFEAERSREFCSAAASYGQDVGHQSVPSTCFLPRCSTRLMVATGRHPDTSRLDTLAYLSCDEAGIVHAPTAQRKAKWLELTEVSHATTLYWRALQPNRECLSQKESSMGSIPKPAVLLVVTELRSCRGRR